MAVLILNSFHIFQIALSCQETVTKITSKNFISFLRDRRSGPCARRHAAVIILQLSGVAMATRTISWGLNMQIECGWCSYCSSFCNFENQCFRIHLASLFYQWPQLWRYICLDYYLGPVSGEIHLSGTPEGMMREFHKIGHQLNTPRARPLGSITSNFEMETSAMTLVFPTVKWNWDEGEWGYLVDRW